MAGGVLVEQRVVEDRLERSDPPFAVDQRELAEPRAAAVLRQERPQCLGARVGVRLDLHGTTPLETNGEPFDDPALRVQRLGGANDSFDTLRVRRREYLLSREVRHV